MQETQSCGFDPGVTKIPWRRKWQPTPVFLPGKIPWTEKSGRLQSIGSQRVGPDLATEHVQCFNTSSPDRAQHSWNMEAEAPSFSQDSIFGGSANLSPAQLHTFAHCLQLLTKDPESRLSSLGDVQSAPYLADMNWDAVLEKALTPGFVPNVSEVLSCDIQPCAGSPSWVFRNTLEAGRGEGVCWPHHLSSKGITFHWDSAWIWT